MSNQINYRRKQSSRNTNRDERPHNASCCAGEGANGARGRAKWKKLSQRAERRALKEGRIPSVPKIIRRSRVEYVTRTIGNPPIKLPKTRTKSSIAKPIPDTTNDRKFE